MASKLEYMGKKLMTKLTTHDDFQGGTLTEITGSQGSGKTSAMLAFLTLNINKYPKEKIFFSNTYDAPIQFNRLSNYHLMVKTDSNVKVYDRKTHKEIHPPITYFTDFKDCYQKAKRGISNVVFFGDRTEWRAFIHYLRSAGEWCSVFVDEFSEIAPAQRSGDEWTAIEKFAVDLKEIRKCWINIFYNSQSKTDIDYRVRSKVMCKILLPGARADKGAICKQPLINQLREDKVSGNNAIIEFNNRFGMVQFSNLYQPDLNKVWEVRVEG